MAASSSSFFLQRGERRGRWGSPERTVVWSEPKPKAARKKVAVVYYLCNRDGHLDHPHFLEMELVPRPPPAPAAATAAAGAAGLYLGDFTARLDALRGGGMAGMYSWSAKRRYRNGYVWQDLADDDLIHPAHGNDEYVLKGSPLLLFLPPPPPPSSSAAVSHRKNRGSSLDMADDCSNNRLVAQQPTATQTQTDRDAADPSSTEELGIDEISPPPSSSSPDDALESCSRDEVGVIAGGRMRASAVLMQIFSCGSVSMPAVKPRRGRGRGHARTRSDLAMASSASSNRLALADKEEEYASARAESGCLAVERDFFSGSLIESDRSKKRAEDDALLRLKRSSSCNADRGAARVKPPAPANGCLPSRGSRAPKKSSTAAERQSRDGGECKGASATAADGPGGR